MDERTKELVNKTVLETVEGINVLLEQKELFAAQSNVFSKAVQSLQNDGGFSRDEAVLIVSKQGPLSVFDK